MKKWVTLVAVLTAVPAEGQNTGPDKPPVIDVHFHGFTSAPAGAEVPMCPNQPPFVPSDPKKECTPKLYPAPPGKYVEMITAEMERLNVTAVVFGTPEQLAAYEKAAPGRVIPGRAFGTGPGTRPQAEQLQILEAAFTEGGFKVMGEINLQAVGMSPSDMTVDAYFALAERLDIPVAIHMAGGGGGAGPAPNFRASAGDPLLLDEMLARHPKLRVQVMHAGYPLIDNMVAMLQASSRVYVDIAGIIWGAPLYAVNRYIERLVKAGFGDRVMFGSDQLLWPGLMAYSISIIQNADYLTPQEKRDILYNNAARFLRLEKKN